MKHNLTYADLLESLQTLNPEQLNQTVTVEILDEFYDINEFYITEYDDVLDSEHFVIKVL